MGTDRRLFLSISAVVSLALPAIGHAAWNANGNGLCRYAFAQQNPEIAADGTGGAFVVWNDVRDNLTTKIDLYAQHVLANGDIAAGWPAAGLPICTANNEQYHFGVASDGAGGALIVWDDARTSSATDIYAQRVSGAGVVAWSANGVPLSTAPGEQFYPKIVGDGSGGAIAVWYGGTTADVHAQHVLAAGTVDPAWPANGLPVAAATGAQYEAQIIAAGTGGWIVAFSDTRGASADIYAQRVLIGGSVDPSWPVNGVGVCVGFGDQFGPELVSDGAGGAIVAWNDSRNGYDVFAQRVRATGTVDPAWPVNGRALCGLPSFQNGAKIASDGSGGAIVTWMDLRAAGNAYDIYAQRVLSTGALDPAWPSTGRALCTLMSGSNPQIVAGASGDAIISWQDVRTPNDADVYAQHVLGTGAVDPTWSTDGIAVCTAIYNDVNVRMATNGAGGAIVTWADSRESSHEDIYAQSVPASGALADVRPRDASPAFAVQALPNPAAHGRVAFRFALPAARRVHAEVFDVAGHHVRTVAGGQTLEAGEHALRWDGYDESGAEVPGGIYWVMVRAGDDMTTRKVAVLR